MMGIDKKQCLCLDIGTDIKEGKNTGAYKRPYYLARRSHIKPLCFLYQDGESRWRENT